MRISLSRIILSEARLSGHRILRKSVITKRIRTSTVSSTGVINMIAASLYDPETGEIIFHDWQNSTDSVIGIDDFEFEEYIYD